MIARRIALVLVALSSPLAVAHCNVEDDEPGQLRQELTTWTRCAAEAAPTPGDICTVPGTRTVRYGARGKYTKKVVTGRIECSDGAFGVTVPTPYQNFCDYSSEALPAPTPTPAPTPAPTTPPPTTTPPATVTWTRCAAEAAPAPGDTCTFSGTREVRYGVPGAYTVKVATGSIKCEDGAFGVTVATPYQNFCDYSSVDLSGAAPPPSTTPPPATPPPSTPPPATGAPGPRVTTFTSSGPITATPGQVISGVRISNPNGPCIVITVANVTVRDSDIGPCGGGANIEISSGANGVVVEYNSIHDGYRGVLVDSSTNVTTNKNKLTTFKGGCGGCGSAIEYDYATGGTIDGNQVRGQNYASDAVSFFEASNVRLTNNDIDVGISEPSSAGFTMGDMRPGSGHDPGRNNYVAFNTVRQTGGSAAGVFGSSGNTVLEKNCFTAGIQAYNYSGIFVGVTVQKNVINMASPDFFVPDTSVIAGWSTNVNSTNCALVPQ